MRPEGSLAASRRRDGVVGSGERDEEGVALSVDLVSVKEANGLAQQWLMLRHRSRRVLAEIPGQVRGAFDVGNRKVTVAQAAPLLLHLV
jgi:hypothetical protein